MSICQKFIKNTAEGLWIVTQWSCTTSFEPDILGIGVLNASWGCTDHSQNIWGTMYREGPVMVTTSVNGNTQPSHQLSTVTINLIGWFFPPGGEGRQNQWVGSLPWECMKVCMTTSEGQQDDRRMTGLGWGQYWHVTVFETGRVYRVKSPTGAVHPQDSTP